MQINECDALRCCSPVNFRTGHLSLMNRSFVFGKIVA